MNLHQAQKTIIKGRMYMDLASNAFSRGDTTKGNQLIEKAYNCFLAVPENLYPQAKDLADQAKNSKQGF